MGFLDLRIVFLFLLLLTIILFTLRNGPTISADDLKTILLDFLLVPAALGTVAVFGFLLTRTDPMPLLRAAAYQQSLQQLVSFEQTIPSRLDDTISVQSILREDTDGDRENEWVVFYKFDLQNGQSPIKAVIYDYDRGNPPVIFPYHLRVPDRDYLSEGATSRTPRFQLLEVTSNPNETNNVNELMVSDSKHLSIFQFVQNSEAWDFPRDAPPRYQAIGSFFGDGGVRYNADTKNITVIDRNGYERSQLAVRSVYELQPNGTYWADNLSLTDLSRQLAAPIVSTIDFYEEPPQDIYATAYPEKIVLAFYASACTFQDETLCLNSETATNWLTDDFLAADALAEFQNGNPSYFGLPSFSLSDLSVTTLRYFPPLETDSDLLVTGGGRDTVTGEQPQSNLVDIIFSADGQLNTMRYQMQQIDGQWKIVQRLPLETTALDAPVANP